jgi:hypothetical protein
MMTANEQTNLKQWCDRNLSGTARGIDADTMVAEENSAPDDRPGAGTPHETASAPRAASSFAPPRAPAAVPSALRIGPNGVADTELVHYTPVAALHSIVKRTAEQSATAIGTLRKIMEEQAARGWPDYAEVQRLSGFLLREAEGFNNVVFKLHFAANLKTVPRQ